MHFIIWLAYNLCSNNVYLPIYQYSKYQIVIFTSKCTDDHHYNTDGIQKAT